MKLPQPIKSIGKEIIHNSSLLREIYLKKRFSQEIMLFSGQETDNSPQNDHQSVLFFTLHKCASVYVNEIFEEVSKSTSITSVNLDNYLLMSKYPSLNTILDRDDAIFQTKLKNSFKPTGYLYNALRYPKIVKLVENLDDYRILLMLRDPRDVLTSAYFSFGYTHTLPIVAANRDNFIARRNKIASQTVDEFVLAAKDDWSKMYNFYCQNLIGKPNVLLIKFEDMINNFNSWLSSILEFIDLEIDQKKVTELVDRANNKKVKPTDHKKILKPETIDILNIEFREIVNILGYD